MALNFSLSSEMGMEVKKKLFGKSYLKKLLDKISFSLNYDLVELYLESPDFPLKPSGTLSFLKEPIELDQYILYIGEIYCEVPTGIGYQIDSVGNYYEGNFLESKFHGDGRLFTPKGWLIQGKFEECRILLDDMLNRIRNNNMNVDNNNTNINMNNNNMNNNMK